MLFKNRITRHQSSSLTPTFNIVLQVVKSSIQMVSKIALINAKMRILRKANKVLSKHRRVKE